MKKAVQLYSIRILCESDFEQALKLVSEYGYEGVEFAGFFDIDSADMKAWLEKYNLVAVGSHTGIELLRDDLDGVIAYNKAIGNRRIVCPGVGIHDEENTLKHIEEFKVISKKLKENGMQFYYHNHAHEFAVDNGKYILDILADGMAKDELMLELDCYWLYNAGLNPVEYMTKRRDRMDVFHLKDGTKENGTAVGKGEVDIKNVLDYAERSGLEWFIVEAEAGTTIEEQLNDVKNSIDYVNAI